MNKIIITDKDIEWVQTIMTDIEFDECRINILKNMNPIDIHACPGSGKTTLLVAKLAILANKWKEVSSGICVLSHTNVAREEIQERLGDLEVGKKLLSYPHFIGTFQSFLDTFISMPILRSCDIPVNIVDTGFVTERRWNNIYAKKWLESNRKDKSVCDPIDLPYKFDVTCAPTSNTYKTLIKVTRESRKRGEFTFNEMEMYAYQAVKKISSIREIIQERYPIMFIDEAQDTKIEIWNLINKLYESISENVFYQAYGDSNQAIFNSYEKMEDVDLFPRKGCLEMLNSKRFVNSIADLASGVALDGKKMIGEGQVFKDLTPKHTIFLFDKGQESKVLDSYATLILNTFSDDELKKYDKYGCHVLGMVQKLNDQVDESATRLSNYFTDYNPETKKGAPSQLIDYFYIAEEHFEKSGEYSQKLEYICRGIVRLVKMTRRKELTYSNTAFRTIVKSFQNCDIRKHLLKICNMSFTTEKEWNILIKTIYSVFFTNTNLDKLQDNSFIKWKRNNSQDNEKVKVANQKQYIDKETGRSVDLKFGSIHSSKGRTHLSTLIVETKYYEYNLESILPWLAGKSKKLGKRNKQRLKCQYVAMTRAKGLICLAMQKESVSEKTRKELCDFGWCVKDV